MITKRLAFLGNHITKLSLCAGVALGALVVTPAEANRLAQLGTSFDCGRDTSPTAVLVCGSEQVRRADLEQLQKYYILRHMVPAAQSHFRDQIVSRITALREECNAQAPQQLSVCVSGHLNTLRQNWIGTIVASGNQEALEEAQLSVDQLLTVQTSLQQAGYLPSNARTDGVFGGGTRAAVSRFQSDRGIQPSGFVSGATQRALQGTSPGSGTRVVQPPAPAPSGYLFGQAVTAPTSATQPPLSGQRASPVQPATNTQVEGAAPRSQTQPASQTLLVEGVGSTIESAVQNAAENALRQVVGSFISTDVQVQRRTQIADGIREQSRTVSRQMREYSQGSIQTFEVLESRQDGALFRVSARAVVRLEDFRVYMQRAVEGSVEINQGLFGQSAAQQRNQVDQSHLLLERVAMPLASGQGLSFRVHPPQPLTAQNIPCTSTSQQGAERSLERPSLSYSSLRDSKNFPCPDRNSRSSGFDGIMRGILNGSQENYFLFSVDARFDSSTADSIFSSALNLGGGRAVRPGVLPHNRHALVSSFSSLEFRLLNADIWREARSRARIVRTQGSTGMPEFAEVIFTENQGWRQLRSAIDAGRIRLEVLDPQNQALLSFSFPTRARTNVQGSSADCDDTVNQMQCVSGRTPPAAIMRGYRPLLLQEEYSSGGAWVMSTDRNYRFYIIARIPTEVLASARTAVVQFIPGQ